MCDVLESSRLFCEQFSPIHWVDDVHSSEFLALPPCDIVTAGFPCQPYSSEGDEMGETDIRSTVVVPILEHIGQTRPRGVVLENVRGFMWTKHEKIRESILNALRSFGYKVHVQLLNSRDFKVPQIRERVYIVAIRGDIKAPDFQFPEPQGEPYSLSKFLDKGIVPRMSDLTRRRVADTILAIKAADGVNPLKSD